MFTVTEEALKANDEATACRAFDAIDDMILADAQVGAGCDAVSVCWVRGV